MSCPHCWHCQRATQVNQGTLILQDLVTEVTKALGLEERAVMQDKRALRPAFARRLVCHAARELTTMSFPEIARFFQLHYTSVVQGVKRVNDNPKHLQAAQNLAARIREKATG